MPDRHRKDALWGEITASFYAEYEVPSVSLDESIDYLFDSITIRLYSSGDYLGDNIGHPADFDVSPDRKYPTGRCELFI